MDRVLHGLKWYNCLVYIDDIVVVGGNTLEHLQNPGCVLSRLREAGLRVKPSKCRFLLKEVKFLGHIISEKGISTDPGKTEAIQKWPVPSSKRELQQFLGLANYYRRFIKSFALIAKPLQRLTEKGAPFEWTAACGQKSFDDLRKCL